MQIATYSSINLEPRVWKKTKDLIALHSIVHHIRMLENLRMVATGCPISITVYKCVVFIKVAGDAGPVLFQLQDSKPTMR